MRKELRQETGTIHTNGKDVVLMNAIFNFALPNKAPAEFIEIATFGENDVPFLEQISLLLFSADCHRLHLAQVEITRLNIRHPQIRKRESFVLIDLPPFGDSSLDGAGS